MKWLRLTAACICAARTSNQLYRLCALGQVRTRREADGRLAFAAEDLDRLREGATDCRKGARGRRAPTLAG